MRPASPEFVRAVADYVDECFDGERPTSGWVFPNAQGEPFNRHYTWRWKRTKELVGIRGNKRFHDLRSGFVSHLIEQGLPMHDVAYLARHTDASLTAKRYAHADRHGVAQRLSCMRAEGERLDRRLGDVRVSAHGQLERRRKDDGSEALAHGDVRAELLAEQRDLVRRLAEVTERLASLEGAVHTEVTSTMEALGGEG